MKQFRPDRQQFGLWKALRLFLKRRHVLQIAAYLLLVAALAWGIQTEHDHNADQRQAIAAATRQQFIAGCERGNALRIVLVGILEESRPQIAQAVKRGQITPAEAKAYYIRLDRNIAIVGPQTCTVNKTLQVNGTGR